MPFFTGNSDDYPYDRYLTFTEASEILGTGNHTRVRKLVLEGKLSAYSIPESSKLRVKKSELLILFDQNFQNLKK
jgi:excisionase family DNA binding protein